MAQDKEGRFRPALVWSVLISVVLILGAFAALFFYGREDRRPISRLKTTQEFAEPAGPPAPAPGPPPAPMAEAAKPAAPAVAPKAAVAPPSGPRSYKVREGDNLWTIASKGKLVNNPWEWRTILVQNKDKIDYAFVSETDGRWRVMVETGEVLTVSGGPTGKAEGPVTKKYAVQLVALLDTRLDTAMKIVKALLAEGQYAYLYRTEVNGRQWYRIRAGFFESKDAAEEKGKEIVAKYAKANGLASVSWVMLPSDRELRGDRLDFGAQRARPWVIELPERESHQAALADLRGVAKAGDFVYIAQRREGEGQPFRYRTRIGFFATRDDAQAMLGKQDAASEVWKGAAPQELKSFEEIMPGQNLKVAAPKPS
ncbi:MAG: SPOR domain-containing protein [Candidatus Lambdaproteobacteria bacterium]|nr:SPOR domain-containing protein [Candidatus Lambdaproteobacteria bacterium]